jgi:hypothetical protein
MAHVFSHRPLTTEAPVRARVSPSGICGGQSATMTGFFSEFFSLVSIIPSLLHTHNTAP